jgi:putative sigma-54 modulation protein
MQISFTGHHLEITPSLKAFVQEKFQKLERHSDDIQTSHVVFSIEKLDHIAEATLNLNQAKVYAKAEAESMYAAIDLLMDKLDRQLIKFKEKSNHHRQDGVIHASEDE